MKAKRFLITKILLAVAMCLAIVFAFVPWSAKRAYAVSKISADTVTVNGSNASEYVTLSGGLEWGSDRIKFGKDASANQSISFTTGIKYNLVITINSNSNSSVDAIISDSNGTEIARRTSPAKGETVATAAVLLDPGTYSITSSLKAELRITQMTFTKASVDVTGVTLNHENMTLVIGETGTLEATVSPDNATDKTVTWASDNENVATIANGTVTAVAEGTANITATASGKSASCAVKVTATQICEVYFTVDGEQVAYEAVTPNTAVTITVSDPEKAGYKFIGWYNGDTKYEFTDTISTDLTLEAKFEKDASKWATVTFMNGETQVATQEVLKGTAATLPETPVKSGYNFDGWYNGEVRYNEGDLVNTNITLTAKWSEIPKASGVYVIQANESLAQTIYTHDGQSENFTVDFGAVDYQKRGIASFKVQSNYISIPFYVDNGSKVSVVVNATTTNANGLQLTNNMTSDKLQFGNGQRGTNVYEDSAAYTFTTNATGELKIKLEGISSTNNVHKITVTITPPAPVVEDVEVVGYTATLSDYIGFNFFVKLNNEATADIVKATCAGENLEMAMPAAEADGTYKITVKVVARLMADDITIQLYNGTTAVGKSITHSVKAYAETLLADQNESACHELVRAMLNYGAAVQTQLNYNTDKLANANYAQDAAVVADAYKLTADKVQLSETTVTLKSVNIYFLTDTTLVVRFNANENVTFTCEGKTVNTTVANGVVSVEISGIKAKEINTALTISVVDGATTGSVEISVSNYCYAAQTKASANMQAAAKALHAYGLAAANYKG